MTARLFSLALGGALLLPWVSTAAHAQRRGSSARLVWMGASADKVAQGKNVKPDGKTDGHFRLTLVTAGVRRVVHMLLRSCDSRGVLTGRAAWDTDRARLWVLGVFSGGRSLTKVKGKVIDRLKGRRRYELFASKPLGGFRPGSSYCVYVTFSDGMGVSARAAITEPVRSGLSYSGRSRDRLGGHRRPYPDGVADHHFVVRVDTAGRKVELRSISLFRIDGKGHKIPGQRWDTARTHRAWLLAVERGGRRLNRTDRPIRDRIHGLAEYHIYGSSRGALRGGERFKVVLRFASGGPSVAVVTLPAPQRARPAAPIKLALRYHGFVADKVGRGSHATPDGRPDAKFTLNLDTGGRTLHITGLELSVSDARGKTWRKTWDTRPGGNWVLGVQRGGRRLNPTDRRIPHTVKGRVSYTLWAAADTYTYRGHTYSFFSKGGYFTARIYVDGHLRAISTVRLHK